MKTILLVSAGSANPSSNLLDEEMRQIEQGLWRSTNRNQFDLRKITAATTEDLRRAMLDFQPNIIHFCGEGRGEEGLLFWSSNGSSNPVNVSALAKFFNLFREYGLECVFLSACYSEPQARAIARHIDFVIGIRDRMEHRAISFATAFYDSVGAGKPFPFSFEFAKAASQMDGEAAFEPVFLEKAACLDRRLQAVGFRLGYIVGGIMAMDNPLPSSGHEGARQQISALLDRDLEKIVDLCRVFDIRLTKRKEVIPQVLKAMLDQPNFIQQAFWIGRLVGLTYFKSINLVGAGLLAPDEQYLKLIDTAEKKLSEARLPGGFLGPVKLHWSEIFEKVRENKFYPELNGEKMNQIIHALTETIENSINVQEKLA
jgi:hypothetical protein